MKRYALEDNGTSHYDAMSIEEDPDGEYVRLEDVMDELKSRLERYEFTMLAFLGKGDTGKAAMAKGSAVAMDALLNDLRGVATPTSAPESNPDGS